VQNDIAAVMLVATIRERSAFERVITLIVVVVATAGAARRIFTVL
jgi:hypothetical protein